MCSPNGIYIRGKQWDNAEVDILLSIWKENIAVVKCRQIELIRSELNKNGFERTNSQIAAKIGNITNEFRTSISKNIPLSDNKQAQFEKLSCILNEQVKLQQARYSFNGQIKTLSSSPSSSQISTLTFQEPINSTLNMPPFYSPEPTLNLQSLLTLNIPFELQPNTGDPIIDFYLMIHYQETIQHQRRSELLRYVLVNYLLPGCSSTRQ